MDSTQPTNEKSLNGVTLGPGKPVPLFITPASAANFHELVEALKKGHVTAFIGAGLSASLQPTWPTLHAELQRRSGLQPPRPFEATFAPADFADFRDAISAEQYLDILRSQFGGLVTDYPDLYRILDETNGFEQLVTTNYDEFLASVAASNNRSPHIAVYPNLEEVGARYVYLHGRAEQARYPSDLILCEDDYDTAYEMPGRAKRMIHALFLRAGLFVGSSLQDPDLMALIRERKRHSGATGADSLPPLFAIVAVKCPPDGTDADLARAAGVVMSRLRRLGVHGICYRWDPSHTQLRALLLQLQHEAERRPIESVFLLRVRELNKLGQLSAPKAEEIERVRSLISGVPELARHFFGYSATSLAWYDALKESVIIPGVVEPRDIGNGSRQVDAWTAAPYIARIAAQQPEVIVELIERLGASTNWHVQTVLARLATSIPDHLLRQTLLTLASWMDEPNGSFNRVSELLLLVPDRLVQRGGLSLAFEIVAELLSPIGGNSTRGQLLRLHDHWMSDLRSVVDQLIEEQPQKTYQLLKDRLLQAVEADQGESPASSLWRAAIGDHGQNFTDIDESLHFLLEVTRDALLAWLEVSPRDVADEICGLLSADSMLLRRLALYALTVHPELASFVRQPLISEDDFHRYELFHELAVLLHERFSDLDEDSKSLVHRLIAAGPPRRSDETDEQWQSYRDDFRWHWLQIVPRAHWTEDERRWWEELRVSREPLEHPTFHIWHGPFEGEVEPRSEQADELALGKAWERGGATALSAALRTMPGSWWSLAQMVRQDPINLVSLAALFDGHDVGDLVTYFSAYEAVLESKAASVGFDWMPLLELMERIDPDDLVQHRWTSSQMASLIDHGITSEFNPIPSELLDRALSVLVHIVELLSHPLKTEPAHGGRVGLNDQLNEPAGKAADAFMRCVWKQLFEMVDEPRKLPQSAGIWIERALKEGWGGLEMRHALGEFWYVLDWGEPNWLTQHTDDIWPSGNDAFAVNARRAFLFGFLTSRSWRRTALAALHRMYADVIHDLGGEHPLYLDERQLTEPFVQHLVLGWLYDIPAFDFNGLLGEFIDVAPDAMRAIFVRQLGFHYRMNETNNAPDLATTESKRDEYWRRRVEALRDQLPISEPSEELGAFLVWAKNSERSIQSLEKRLDVSIDHLTQGGGARDLLEFIAAHGEAEPLPALRLLLRLCGQLETEQRLHLWGHGSELVAAIETVCRGVRLNHRTKMRQLAERLMRAGLVDLGTRLQDCSRRR